MTEQIPAPMVLDASHVQRMITAAALEAAKEVDKQNRLTKDDVEEMIEEALGRFCDRLGIPTEKKEMAEWRDDINKMRKSVAFQDELKSNGFKAAVGLVIAAALTAFWVGFQTVFKR